jgi:nitroreductase
MKNKMEKPATTHFNIHPLLKKRWSPRAYEDKPVRKEVLQRILEAARWSPSSFNEQPWRFLVGIKGDNTWDKIMETLAEFNQKWAKLAPVLIMSMGKKTLTRNNKPNKVFIYDVGQSVAHITFQVMEEGLYMHQMGGFDGQKAAELFQIPEDYQPLTVMAIGYAGPAELLTDEKMRNDEKSERKRKDLTDLVFQDNYGSKSDLF